MSYITKATFKPFVGETNDSKKFGYFVEKAGYVSPKTQIESFLYAGEKLQAARSEMYDTDSDNPIEDNSYFVRDMELSEIGAVMNHLANAPVVETAKQEVASDVPDQEVKE